MWGADPGLPPTAEKNVRCLGPADLQLIDDPFDTVEPTHNFLGHLLLKERADRAFDPHVAVGSFYPQFSSGDVGISVQSGLNLINERRDA